MPFQRLVREIAQERKSYVCFQLELIEALQRTADEMMVKLLEEAQKVELHTKRVTVMPKDIVIFLQPPIHCYHLFALRNLRFELL